MNEEKELLPCPFCGGEARMCCDFYDKIYTAGCNKCGASIGVHWGNKLKIAPHIVRIMYHGGDKVKPSERDSLARKVAVERWNTRVDKEEKL